MEQEMGDEQPEIRDGDQGAENREQKTRNGEQRTGEFSTIGIRETQEEFAVADSGNESVFQIETDKIRPNPYQPRRDFNEEELRELAASIREFGIIQPLIVSKIEEEHAGGVAVYYELLAGERRLKAARLLGLPRVPAIVRTVSHKKSRLEIALIENLQRSDLNAIEAAKAYARLQEEFGMTQREIASRVGKSRETIANMLRLLNLPSHIQESVRSGRINESHARTLLSVSDPQEQEALYRKLIGERMSVRDLRNESRAAMSADSESRYWQKQLEERLGAPVRIVRRGERGKMIIVFHSDEEWRGILEKLIGGVDL